jgi:Tfp pilus assembly pilus retraction ATPase PilT
MIENDKQRQVTVNQISNLTYGLKVLIKNGKPEEVHTIIYKAQKAGLKSLIDELKEQVEEYDGIEIS